MDKKCCACWEIKQIDAFWKLKKSLDWLQSRCKICKREYDNKYHYNLTLEQRTHIQSTKKKYKQNRSNVWCLCKNCNNFFYPFLSTKNQQFCCRGCYNEKYKKDNYEKMYLLLVNWTYKQKQDWRYVKKCLIYQLWHKCFKCWLSEWLWKQIPLELHHIDWDCYNNGIDNLELLCANCHTFTETYKSKNKNSTRKR